jgi:hypothetical protein
MPFTPVATDAFTEADGGVPANFTSLDGVNGEVQIVGNKFHSPYGAYSGAVRTAGSYSNDQYSSVVLSGFSGVLNGDVIGVIWRASTDIDTARDFYFAYVTDNATPTVTYGKVVNGTTTNFSLDSTVTTWANGDVLRGYAIGTTVAIQKNGTDLLSTTDAALSTGRPGILARVGGNDVLRGDDWEGGDATAASGTSPKFGKLLNGILTQGSLVR